MLGRLSHYVRRWIEVPSYSSSTDVQFALLNLLASKQSPAHIDRSLILRLLELFFKKGFQKGYPGSLKEAEKQQMLQALHALEHKKIFRARNFPFLHDEIINMRLGVWLSNLLREDLGVFPAYPDHVLPISIHAPKTDLNVIRQIYQTFDPVSYEQKVVDLERYIDMFDLQYWHELSPFFVGPVWMSTQEHLLPEDSLLIMRVVSDFIADPKLGMVSIRKRRIQFFRTQLSESFIYPNMPIRLGMNLPNFENKIRSLGGRTTSVWYPSYHWDFLD